MCAAPQHALQTLTSEIIAWKNLNHFFYLQNVQAGKDVKS